VFFGVFCGNTHSAFIRLIRGLNAFAFYSDFIRAFVAKIFRLKPIKIINTVR